MLKVKIKNKKKLNPWEWYITYYKENKKNNTEHNSKNNSILKGKINKKLKK